MNEQHRHCTVCGAVIDPERIEALPDTHICVGCARKKPAELWHDPNEVCAKASSTGRNGFAAND